MQNDLTKLLLELEAANYELGYMDGRKKPNKEIVLKHRFELREQIKNLYGEKI